MDSRPWPVLGSLGWLESCCCFWIRRSNCSCKSDSSCRKDRQKRRGAQLHSTHPMAKGETERFLDGAPRQITWLSWPCDGSCDCHLTITIPIFVCKCASMFVRVCEHVYQMYSVYWYTDFVLHIMATSKHSHTCGCHGNEPFDVSTYVQLLSTKSKQGKHQAYPLRNAKRCPRSHS